MKSYFFIKKKHFNLKVLLLTEEAHDMGMRIRLYGMERMRRERMIGETIIGFASLNLDVTSTHWIILEPRSNLSVRFNLVLNFINLSKMYVVYVIQCPLWCLEVKNV